ncbi:MAG: hypothetical protein IPL62_11845 [Caulobacteraceae bacterium]|nr:hypothetical protein [Caulobacteraceae bacterium]
MDDLDTLVRRVDEDRWLAARFAPPLVRERLIAIYAVNYEIARRRPCVKQGWAPFGSNGGARGWQRLLKARRCVFSRLWKR